MSLVKAWWPVWLIVALMSTVLTLAIQSPTAVPLSPHAYIMEGVVCTINLDEDRPTARIRQDLEKCFTAHMSWKERNNYGR